MENLKHFLYLDTDLVDSLLSQYNSGVVSSITKSQTSQTKLNTSVGFDLKIVKGDLGGDDNDINEKAETINPHHYIYNLLEKELLKNSGNDTDIVKLCGDLRIVDSCKVADDFSGLKELITGFDAVNKLSKSPVDNILSQEIRDISSKSKPVSKLIRQLTADRLLAYIGNNKPIPLDRANVINYNSAEFANNCTLFSGDYVVVGIKSTSIEGADQDNGSDDMLLLLGKAFAEVQRIIKTSPIKPIAIYKIVSA